MTFLKTWLNKNILFKEFSEEELERIVSISSLEKLATGDVIFEQGNPSDSFFLVKFGTVKITQETASGDSIDVRMVETGGHFGEIPFFDLHKRFATAIAHDKCEIIKIEYGAIKGMLSHYPEMESKFFKAMASFLSNRLRMTATDLCFAKEKISHKVS